MSWAKGLMTADSKLWPWDGVLIRAIVGWVTTGLTVCPRSTKAETLTPTKTPQFWPKSSEQRTRFLEYGVSMPPYVSVVQT